MNLKHFKSLLDQVSKILSLPLTVVNFITKVVIANFEKIQNWQDLTIVRNEGFSNCVRTGDKGLQYL